VHSVVVTYRHQLISGLAKAPPRDVDTDPRSLGLVMNDPGGYLRVEQAALGPEDAVIMRLSSTGYEGRLRDDAFFTFVLQRVGRYAVRIAGREYSMSPGSLLAFRPNERQAQVWPGKAGVRTAATLQLPIARVNALAQAHETTAEAAFPRDGIALHGDAGLTLARILPQLADGLFLNATAPPPPRVAQEIRNLIDDVLCELIGRTVGPTSSRRIFPAFHRVRQAEEMMDANSDEPLSILEIAQALGISLRSLQLAFAEVHEGQSPRDVLNCMRLEKARQRLIAANGEGQVTTIALDSGFHHLSRFAHAYARTFGERPSETLARRRA
jgi:AraC-like DNA-binding protein